MHLAAIGHPLVGDPVYGDRRTTLGLTRPFLHAAELSFDHPGTGERLTFDSPLPADLATFLADLQARTARGVSTRVGAERDQVVPARAQA